MSDVSVVIPNYNGISFLETCLRSVLKQTGVSVEIIVVDNGSSDGSQEYIREHFKECILVALDKNYGFCRAVNEGIRRASGPYVILLNNDTEVQPDFASALLWALREDERRFSCAAQMLQYKDRELLDNGGDFYCALGWGFARGKGKKSNKCSAAGRIFSSCAGAAIYRKELVEKLGGFDEAHFAYLEDMDLSYRAKLHGYYHWYVPEAKVFHIGSATSGSRHNHFKVVHSARNNVYLLYKNMPFLQMLLNGPFLLAGFAIKYLFFVRKGLGRDYRQGLLRGFRLCREHPDKRVRFHTNHFWDYVKIQLELWRNILLLIPWL